MNIQQLQIPSFNLFLTQLDLDTLYYPLSQLSKVLGYRTPQSLIQSIPNSLKFSIKQLYTFYTIYMDQFTSYTPVEYPQFKSTLSIYKPLWFTNIEGVNWVLSKNTFTIPRLKQSIAQLLGLTVISPPRKESIFYSTLQSLLDQHSITIQRHLHLAGYFVDCAIELDDKKIIIEYDENNHLYYPKDKEYIRESALKQLGYAVIRVKDDIPPEQSAIRVYLSLLEKISRLT